MTTARKTTLPTLGDGKGPRKQGKTIKLPVPLWNKLQREADRDEVSVAEHIRRIVDLHLLRGRTEALHSRRITELEKRMASMERRSDIAQDADHGAA